MTTIMITEMETGAFGAEIDEGGVVTGHRVHVPEGLVDDLQLQDVDATQLVRESLGFLLDRVPATSVPPELSLADIAADHEDYYDELRTRLATPG